MSAKEVPAQKVLKGHFVFADSPTILRLCLELPIDPKALTLEYAEPNLGLGTGQFGTGQFGAGQFGTNQFGMGQFGRGQFGAPSPMSAPSVSDPERQLNETFYKKLGTGPGRGWTRA